jgi:AraC-like DNA-binding protein
MQAGPPPPGFVPIQPALAPNVARDGLVYREHAPPPALAADVACFWTIEAAQRRVRPYPYSVVPDGCIDLVFDVGNGAGAWVYGALDRPVIAELEGTVALFGVRVRPGRFGALVGPPAGSMEGCVHDLAAVLGRHGTRCDDAIRHAPDTASRVAVASAGLGALQSTLGHADRLGIAITDAIVAAEAPRVDGLARRFGISARHLGRVCRAATGLGPKRLARVIRAQRALRALRDSGSDGLAAIAAGLGFADQAHLTSELRVLAGTTPGVVRRARGMSDFSKTPPAARR